MDCVVSNNQMYSKSRFFRFFKKVSVYSFEEKQKATPNIYDVDQFLDAIIDFKADIALKTQKLEELADTLEGFTWVENLTENDLVLINTSILNIKDLVSTFRRTIPSYDIIYDKGIANLEINEFKAAVDDLDEVCQDINDILFVLPRNEEFQAINKQLSEL